MNSKVTSITVVTTIITSYLMLFNYHMLDFLNSIIVYQYTVNQILFMILIIGAIGVIAGMFGFNKQSEEQVRSMLKNISGLSDTEYNRWENAMKNQYKGKIESAVPGMSELEKLKSLVTPQTNTVSTPATIATKAVSLADKSNTSKKIKIKGDYPEPSEFIKYLVSLQSTLVLNPKYVLATEASTIQTPLKIINAIPFTNVTETKKKRSWKSKLAIILAGVIIGGNIIYLIYSGGLPIAL